MLNFLRKFRRKETKRTKYLKYALGEILLVVIGILIAFSINNWNDHRKERKVEQEILEQFKVDLESDIESIQRVDYWMQKVIKSCKIVVSELRSTRPWHDSLAVHFDLWNDFDQLGFSTVAISNLRSRGVELIKNKSLRNDLINHYDQTYFYVQKSNDYFREDHVHITYKKFLEHIEPIKWRESAIPNDYQALKKDKEFINHVQWIRNAAEFDSKYNIETIKENRRIIELIKEELKQD